MGDADFPEHGAPSHASTARAVARAAPALNRLALEALTPWSNEAERDAPRALDQQCAKAAADAFNRDGGFINALLQPEALLVAAKLDGSLGQPGGAGRSAFEPLAAAYREALSDIIFKPRDLDAAVPDVAPARCAVRRRSRPRATPRGRAPAHCGPLAAARRGTAAGQRGAR